MINIWKFFSSNVRRIIIVSIIFGENESTKAITVKGVIKQFHPSRSLRIVREK